MPICIYPPLAEDFTTNGLGILTPLECTVEEQAAGKYEIELVHPIDSTLRWMQIQNGCIIKVPAPVRESPLYEAPAIEVSAPVTVTRQVWKATDGQHIRQKPDRTTKKMGSVRKGQEVVELEDAKDPWIKVCKVNGGQVGYMSTRYLQKSRTVEEVIEPSKPVSNIVVEIGQSRDQLFRIYSVEQDSEAGTVTAKGMHVYYDDAGNLINTKYEPSKAALSTVMSKITSSLHQTAEVDYQAIALDGKITGDFSYKTPVEAYLDPDEGIVAQTNAMLVRDNWDAYLLPNMVRDMGVTIRRGKNLIGVEVTNDISDVVTRIIPIGKNKNGDPIGLSGTAYVDSSHINEYPFPRVKRIEYDVQTGKDGFNSDTAVRNELKRLAQEEFTVNGVDLPTYGMEVDFVLLGNTAEYANFASLQAVHLYDTVTVIDEMLGLKAKVRVTGYKWNCLTEQYESVTLGELQDVKQTVYSFNLPNKGVSGNKIMNNSMPGTAMRDASIEYAKIAVAAIEQLTADSLTAITARIKELVAGSVTADELYAGIADITKATIEKADINWASIDELNAAIATLVQANIGTADIDYARIKDLVTDTAIITQGVGGELYISRLAVTEANIVSLTTGELVVKGDDGHFYSLSVDASGNIVTTLKQLNNDDVQDLSINAGEKLVEGSVTAACLNAQEIFADNAIIRQLIAANLDVDKLFAREAFVNLLRTSKIVGDKSITMIVGETEELERLSNIEVIEGTFAQTDRREGEGIRVYSEIKPKQDLSKGAPYPLGGGRNLCPFDEFTTNASGGNTTADAKAPALKAGQSVMLYGETTDGIVLNGSNAQFIFKDDSGATVWAISPRVKGTAVTVPDNYGQATKMHFYTNSSLAGKTVRLVIEVGSATEWSPSTNICPIEGRTKLMAAQRGKNLLSCAAAETKTNNGITVVSDGKGTYTINGTATNAANCMFTLMQPSYIPEDKVIYCHHLNTVGNGNIAVGFLDDVKQQSFMSTTTVNRIQQITLLNGVTITRLNFYVAKGQVVENMKVSTMLMLSSEPSAYEPYQGADYTISFGEDDEVEGGVVYGGTVDWHSGELVVNWATVTLSNNHGFYLGDVGEAKRLTVVGVIPGADNEGNGANVSLYCSHYKVDSAPINSNNINNAISGYWSDGNVYIRDDRFNTYEDAAAYFVEQKNAGTPVQISYKLAEPITIQLTPTQITSLSGTNIIYTDADGGRVEFGHNLTEDMQNAIDALEEAQRESALYLRLDDEAKAVRIGQTGVTSEFNIDAYGAGVSVNGETFSRFEGSRAVLGDMEMRRPANVGGLAFDSIMRKVF